MSDTDRVEKIARLIFDRAVGLHQWDNEFYAEERIGCFDTACEVIAALSQAPHAYQRALEQIALLDEADGHELTVQHAFEAVAIATSTLGKHPSEILAGRSQAPQAGEGWTAAINVVEEIEQDWRNHIQDTKAADIAKYILAALRERQAAPPLVAEQQTGEKP